MGDGTISNELREKVEQGLACIHWMTLPMYLSYVDCLRYYNDTIHKTLGGRFYQDQNDLIKLHQITKNEATALVCI